MTTPGIGRIAASMMQQASRTLKSLERSVQEVVEILQPGPLGATPERWDHARREAADAAVERALARFRAMEARLKRQQQQQEEQQQGAERR